MTIKFICSCGKHLRARDEMAARRSVCPRCGNPVGIPSLKPTHPGTAAAPMTPLERLRHMRDRAPLPVPKAAPEPERSAAKAQPRPPDPRLVRLLTTKGVRRPELTGRRLERRWQQVLVYPLRAWRLCIGLAALLTVLSAGLAMFLPHLLIEASNDPLSIAYVGIRLACILLVLVTIGLPSSFLDCVLDSATAGEVYYIVWSGNPLITILRCGLKWLSCFLAGPVVFAVAGWLYWLRCGDPGVVDWLILTELGVMAIGYWIFALLAVADRGRLSDLNPATVADLAYRLGGKGLGVVLAAALLLLVHLWILLVGVASAHTTAQGWFILAGGWLSGLYWSTFFCRLLGVWCFRTRQS